jgi:hypothetical protein
MPQAHLGNGTVITEFRSLPLTRGKITLVGDAATVRPDTTNTKRSSMPKGNICIPASSTAIPPGGSRKIDQVRSTRDQYEVGELNPNVRSAISYNTDSKIIPTGAQTTASCSPK